MSDQNREKTIAEIWEALKMATPGPWEYEMWQGMAEVYPTTGKHVPICQLWTKTEEPMENAENNTYLIANTPEWFRFLLSELDREREEKEFWRKAAETQKENNIAILEESRKLQQEREKLIEGLRYLMKELGKLPVKPENGTAIHAYRRMREILKEIGVTVE